jgi:hypothetical protein
MFEFLKINITRDQSKDTGMAMTLILLLLNRSLRNEAWLIGAIVALVIDMIVPQVYRPLAVVWFGLARLIGMLTSRIILSFVFFGVVMPIGLLRRFSGKDPLNLKAFKAGSNSVMKERNRHFVAADLEKPY